MNTYTQRMDVGQFTYRGENTAPNITEDCGNARDTYPCDQHYVVRMDGTWVRAFHNEKDAREFWIAAQHFVNRTPEEG
jgi:hypothetical protein